MLDWMGMRHRHIKFLKRFLGTWMSSASGLTGEADDQKTPEMG